MDVMTAIARLQAGMLRPLYEFVFPSSCFACDGPIRNDEHKVCRSCWSAIQRVSHNDALYARTAARLAAEGNITGLVSAFRFEKDGTLQSLIHHLKYNGITDIGVELGKQLGEGILPWLSNVAIAGLIPVPLHPAKCRERGYNQSEYICQGINAVTGLRVLSGLLKRRRYTESQTHLEIEERRRNVAGAFVPAPAAKLSDLTYLIVDDVITTGATMSACAKTLAEHGASRVIACSVALAEWRHTQD